MSAAALDRHSKLDLVPFGTLKILVISISLEDRFLLEQLAKQQRWKIRFTFSPDHGFQMASEEDYDLIFCDHYQRGYPWREVMDRLSATSPRSCIVLLAPFKDDYLWQEVLRHGGYDVVVCPLRPDTTLEAVLAVDRFLCPTFFDRPKRWFAEARFTRRP